MRRQERFESRAKTARLRHEASLEDVDYQAARGLDRSLFLKLGSCDWIRSKRNLLLTGPCGVGKSFLACARFARIARMLRLAKLGRFSCAAQHLHCAVASRRYELVLALSLAGILLVVGATALFWAEGSVQPDKFGSIPRALWWSAVTLRTIGYGDVSPVTPLGKVIAIFVAVAGIGLVALPTGILAAGFNEAVQRDRRVAD